MLQCKDLPTRAILEFLQLCKEQKILHCYELNGRLFVNTYNRGATLFSNWSISIDLALPSAAKGQTRLIQAKMQKLINQGLVDGCACGCRGDFTITEKGQQWLTAN